MDPPAREPLVYGILSDNLILLPESVASTVQDELRATRLSVPGIHEDDESSPPDSDPYNAFDTAEYQNSNWPSPAATIALDECPEELDDIGEQVEYFPSYPRLHIDPAGEAEVVATARERISSFTG